MSSLRFKSKFTTGLNYLDHLQYFGKPNGDKFMINRRLEFSKTMYSKDLYSHYGCVNAIEFSCDGEWLVTGGDDKRVLLWNIDKSLSNKNKPTAMKSEHNSNIFCLGFDSSHSKLLSAGNDEQVLLHDVGTGDLLDVFTHSEAIYGLSVDPSNDNVFASACDNGSLLVWDIRESTNEPFILSKRQSSYHAVVYNPVDPQFLATANAQDGVYLWDIRKPRAHLMKYGPNTLFQSAMSVRFNAVGTHLLALRRRFPPVLYEINSTQPVAEFDHQEYYNSCTMKSCSFAGDKDQYIVSGSDDFKLYIWKIPDGINTKKGIWVNNARYVLRGHRSIVNQVRYNGTYGILASSGVEKIIKLWSTFPLVYTEDVSSYITNKDSLRKVYSPSEFDDLVRESGNFMTHDYSHQSIHEDPRMLAFFDSLVQRDIESWNDPKLKDKLSGIVSLGYGSTSDSLTSDEETERASGSDYDNDHDESTKPSDRSTHQLSLSLSYITKRALANDQADATLKATEKLDPSLDRIAILIAEKRKEEMQKTLKEIKNDERADSGSEKSQKVEDDDKSEDEMTMTKEEDDDKAPESTYPSEPSQIHRLETQIRFWNHMRVELNRDSISEQNSSSGDSESVKNNLINSSKIENKKPLLVVIPSDIRETVSASAMCTTKSILNLESSSSNGMGTSAESVDSTNGAFFAKNSGKRLKRNYRKRSSDTEE